MPADYRYCAGCDTEWVNEPDCFTCGEPGQPGFVPGAMWTSRGHVKYVDGMESEPPL